VLKNPKKHKKTPPKSGWLYWNIDSDDWSKDTSLELMEVSDDEEKKLEEKRKEDKKEAKKVVERAFTMVVTGTAETGKLTRDQFKVVLAGLIDSGHDIAFISDKKMLENNDSLDMFIEVADRDGDKLINLNELLIIMDLGDEKLDSEEEIKEAFKVFDKDGNGLITTEELRFMIVTAGFEEEDEASGMAKMFMTMGDKRGDKKLKIEEVVNLFVDGPEDEDPKDEMKRMFRMYDTNADGFISKKELLEYINSMGYVDEDDTPDYVNMMVNALISGADEDKDGKLTYEEFCYMLQSL
jgi:calmodulin